MSIWYWVVDISSGVTFSSSPGQSSLLLLLSRLFLKTTRDFIQVVKSQYDPCTVHHRNISIQWELWDLTHCETDLKHFIISRAIVSIYLYLYPEYQYCHQSNTVRELSLILYLLYCSKQENWSISMTPKSIRNMGSWLMTTMECPDGVLTSIMSPNNW